MPSATFINPLDNPIFFDVIIRVILIFAIGFLLLLIKYKFSPQRLLKSNLGKIFTGWSVLIPVYLAAIFSGRVLGLIVLVVFMFVAIREIEKASKIPRAYTYSLYFLVLLSLAIASYATDYFLSLPLIYFMVLTFIAIRMNDSKRGFADLSISMFSSIWIIFGTSHFVLLSNYNNTLDDTRSLLLMLIFAVSASDIGAYIFGKFFQKIKFLDKYKIADNISPNKTYIGTLGHIIGAGFGIWVLYFAINHYVSLGHWIVISILIGIFGLVGGLLNSLFKRYYNIKDSSDLIPGHGGILDRIDSSIRVVVILYYYLLLVM